MSILAGSGEDKKGGWTLTDLDGGFIIVEEGKNGEYTDEDF